MSLFAWDPLRRVLLFDYFLGQADKCSYINKEMCAFLVCRRPQFLTLKIYKRDTILYNKFYKQNTVDYKMCRVFSLLKHLFKENVFMVTTFFTILIGQIKEINIAIKYINKNNKTEKGYLFKEGSPAAFSAHSAKRHSWRWRCRLYGFLC